MRTFFKYFLAVIGALLAFMALVQTATWVLVGTPSHIASTAMRIAGSAQGAVGDLLVEQALSGADAQAAAQIEAKRPQLAAAAGSALAGSADLVEGLVAQVFEVAETGAPGRIDLKPLFGRALTAMNAIEPAIPTEVEGGAPIDLKPADLGPLPIVLTVLGLWWVLVLLALACLIGSGLCDRHRGMRKFRAAGIALTIAAGLIVVPTVVSMFLTVSVGDAGPNEQAIVDAVAGTVRNGYLLVAGIALVIGVAVILLSVFLKPKSGHEQPEVAV